MSRVSQTPTYDQLRGERINADVPASEVDGRASGADPDSRAHSGKHRLRDDGPGAAAVCSAPQNGELTSLRTGLGSGRVTSSAPANTVWPSTSPARVGGCGPLPGPGADLAKVWSWPGQKSQPVRFGQGHGIGALRSGQTRSWAHTGNESESRC